MKFEEEMRIRVSGIEDILQAYLPAEEGYQKTVLEAMNYAVCAGGKRLRPMLMAESAELFGGARGELLKPFMAAIEMIHTYSLIHDDLPALDDDDYRRGRKTTHVVYGEAMGILAGDALLNFAYETAAKAFLTAGDDEVQRVARAMMILAKKPGIYGMLGGQVVDVECTGQPADMRQLEFIYENKTGALIECSMMIGAVLAGAGEEEVLLIEAAASKIGMAFQIQDDILDVEGDQYELGKPIGSDAKNAKTTFVTLAGMEEAKRQVEDRSLTAIDLLESLGISEKNPFLKELILWLIHRRR